MTNKQAQQKFEIGMVGLGVMGRNLVLNMADHGFSVAGYDKDETKVEALRKESAERNIVGAANVSDFVALLRKPRAVMMLVPAGAPVDSVIKDLLPHLDNGDLIIDAGNSYFKDTDLRAHNLAAKGVQFLGVGVSGGEEGARHGPSIMPGGPKEAYERVRPVFEAAAAKVNGDACVTWLGSGSTGHFVKMVHNGIEYGVMQLLAETYDLMKRGLGLNDDELHGVYALWNNGEPNGYLVEITSHIFSKQDEKTCKRLIDEILDVAKQKGTGMWTSQSAMELQVPIPTIDLAVGSRDLSVFEKERQQAGTIYQRPIRCFTGDRNAFLTRLGRALFAAMIITYAQGMALLAVASEKYKYHLDLEAVAHIWRGGCIIRAALLEDICAAFHARSKLKTNLTVIFSTYQSIQVIADAQKLGLPEFDLVICDEAHRTTGVEQTEMSQKEASAFVAIHDADFLKAKKRLYMTATPRIYDDASKGKAKDLDVQIYSMDDPAIYGAELHRLDFSEAVRKDLLSDYKVLVLAVDQLHVSTALQQQFAKNKELTLDDAVKIVGCWNGLRKRFVKQEGDGSEAIDRSPMRRAVAFSSRIKDSQKITSLFAEIIKDYTRDPESQNESETSAEQNDPDFLRCEARHVDGRMNSLFRSEQLQWLKEDTTREGTVCRILSNARCLSEGVDVPALDAVMFLNPRNSVVDVVQSVGRVMRKSEGKQCGYIILPIGVPAGVPPEEALADNEKYKVVWQVLQALRAHDDRFNAIINQLELNKQRPDQIQIIGVGGEGERKPGELNDKPVQSTLNFPLQDWENAIFAKIVIKCGTRKYWEQWAQDVAKIAERHIIRITALLKSSDAKYRDRFDKFLQGLRKTLNPSISEDDAIEMLAQHLITKPVFDALFEGYEFTRQNPVSKTMQKMLDLLEEQNLEKETATLDKFYESVRERARGIDNAQGKQKIIVELYDKFFKTAFPRMAERLGIVYTPVEVVDFIIKSADDALKSEFGIGLTDKNVHILDPFTGTGTFIVRLLQSGIIADSDLTRKFREELHANEIILLAYYIAAINIEEAYHGRVKKDYEPFEGIVLTDTFQLSEGKGTFDDPNFQVNSERATRQKKRDIRVIIGNPPYSVGQGNANNKNQNLNYHDLDERIEHTYAANSSSTNINSLYDSYIRAVRWASDRVKDKGIICYVSNGSFIDNNAMSGLRKSLTDEFAAIYCFNLRGNQRTSGETSRQEGGKIFGSGSRTPIAITLLVKNLEHKGKCQLFYHDIGDYLSREEKLNIITEFASFKNIKWDKITPNKNHDWLNQRDEAFEKFMPMGAKEDKGNQDVNNVFVQFSRGAETARDNWIYNFSNQKLNKNIQSMCGVYNQQVEAYKNHLAKRGAERLTVEKFVESDPKLIKWSSSLHSYCERGIKIEFDKKLTRTAMYRPFCKQQIYFSDELLHRIGQLPKLFPDSESENVVICITGVGNRIGFSALISNLLPDLHMADSNGASQNFPLYTYQSAEPKPVELSLGDAEKDGRRLNVSDFALKAYRAAYPDAKIGKEDIFYYVYGILHSPEYKTRFAADLTKMLPRIPLAADFWAFSKAGRKLAEIHLNYEDAKPYPVKEHRDVLELKDEKLYVVEKMRFGKKDKETDKTTIQYNSHITLTGIPLAAYDYVVNGKPAIEWIMDRYQFSKDKDSQIVNDPNDWAREHDDPKYILNLLKSIITVSVETMKVVNGLPALKERK